MKSPWVFLCIGLLIGIVGCCIGRGIVKTSSVGEDAVKLLYDFTCVDNLPLQMRQLERITTESVFNQLSVDREERYLNTYLRFEEESSTVVVQRVSEGCVLYSLECNTIEPSRTFAFFYEVDNAGRICSVRECELIDFIAGDDYGFY